MDKFLKDIPYFVEVARRKSYTQAADALDIPISTLSRRISAMEKELGVPLFKRSTRNVELTDSGTDFFKRCEFILEEAENAREDLIRNVKSATGHVRLSVSPDIYYSYMLGTLSSFAARYPKIKLHVHFATRWADLLTEPYDLDVRIGALPDSSLKAKRLTTLKPSFYASPKLFQSYNMPTTPQDLGSIPWIGLEHKTDQIRIRKGEQMEELRLVNAHTVNSMGIAMEFTLAGLGVTMLVPHIAKEFVDNGQLIPILPGWETTGADMNLVMPPGDPPHRVRLFVDHLAAHFAAVPHNPTAAIQLLAKRVQEFGTASQ